MIFTREQFVEWGRRGGKHKSPQKTAALKSNLKKRWDMYRAKKQEALNDSVPIKTKTNR